MIVAIYFIRRSYPRPKLFLNLLPQALQNFFLLPLSLLVHGLISLHVSVGRKKVFVFVLGSRALDALIEIRLRRVQS